MLNHVQTKLSDSVPVADSGYLFCFAVNKANNTTTGCVAAKQRKTFCEGSMDIFWNCTLRLVVFIDFLLEISHALHQILQNQVRHETLGHHQDQPSVR